MSSTYSQFNWREFLRLARELRKDETDEAAVRSAISRAYYAAFKTAHEYLVDNDFAIYANRGGIHDQVWTVFQSEKSEQMRKIGLDGDRLKRKRVKADYESRVSGLVPNIIDDALATSQKILTALAALPKLRS